jgi:hypothetical protein
MSLGESLLALQSADNARRLLELDDVWTFGSTSAASHDDRLLLADTGHQMQSLMIQIKNELPIVRSITLRDPVAFQAAADQAVRESPLNEAEKTEILNEYDGLGWTAEAAITFGYIERYTDQEVAELALKVEKFEHGADEGDLPPWWRCGYRCLIFAATVGATVAAGGAPLVLGLALGASVLGLGDSLTGCRSEARRSPPDADQIEILVAQRNRGDLEDWEFNLLKRKVLGVPAEGDAQEYAKITNFSRGLLRPIPAPKVHRIPKDT